MRKRVIRRLAGEEADSLTSRTCRYVKGITHNVIA
jgi:hypothetical protein